ncbi:ImmA/IrrE family metallo-endopeptidase [Microbacterium sp. UBA3394]|uniref:ImmA/IrrE family metallo-endopeptidase n=1 Tax=Microbacterium sp. UBA3394 TaxID=1946945 RepID=UPI000C65955A|nr:ImmA/IrrE family metallo-endopeptidase [Microbacterium sp. UBA3394]MAM53387.1 ImmA/IrrE family metallo-endopeptidase [Microbacterium sp.]|tara:strand:- start:1625 stop:2062 length:438 start_codon:yes stop_codon:yes gene_type:complete
MHQLLDYARELGLHVIEKKGRHIGGYHAGSSTIRLDPGMPRRVARSVLAHEIAHHIFGDEPTPFGPARATQERRANEWAALRLIDPDAYADAESYLHGHMAAMAVELDVTVEIVEAFQRILLRVGDTTYVRPRLGVGQYEHRVVA